MMAKSLEDTAFYRYHRLLALNEVGGDPASRRCRSPTFTSGCSARAANAPHGLTATAPTTPSAARTRARASGDRRACRRLDAGRSANGELNARIADHRGRRAPSPAHEYMLYQALVGAWPLEGGRELRRADAGATRSRRRARASSRPAGSTPTNLTRLGSKRFLANPLDPRARSVHRQL